MTRNTKAKAKAKANAIVPAARPRPAQRIVPAPPEKRPRTIRQARNKRVDPYVPILLSQRHWLNGTSYGPGWVKVRQSVSRDLLSNETRAKREIERFRDPEPMGRLMLANRSVMMMPGSSFNETLVAAMTHGQVALRT
jgi:hypothetical protein